MANPNINSPTAVYANNALLDLTSTTETLVISNASGTGKVCLVDSVMVANVDGTSAADVTLTVYNAATNTGTGYKIASTVSVPADSTLIPVLKDAGICLKEGQSLYVTASAANDLQVLAFWKEFA